MSQDKLKILLLEDDEMLCQTMAQFLKQDNYDVSVVYDGEEAIEATYKDKFDLYLFDVNVPFIDGIDVLKLLRDAEDFTPTFLITALIDLDSISKGFDSGCDDYIKKPFDIDELLVRIKAIFKRKNPVVEYGNITFDLLEKRVYQKKEEVDLGSVEKAIFALLIRNVSITVNKSSFFDCMNKPSEAGLRVLISKLKKIFDIDITNVKGIGYKLEKL